MDGSEGVNRVMLDHAGRSRLLGDAFRADLAFACARWLAQPDNATGITAGLVIDELRRIADDRSDLFPDGRPPAPFGDVPAQIRVRTEAGADGAVLAEEAPGTSRLAGTVVLRVDASDPAGIASVEASLDGGAPDALVVDRPVPAPGGIAAAPVAEWVGRLDTRALADGPHQVTVALTDALGAAEQSRHAFVVDNAPPVVTVATLPRADGAVAGDRVTGTVAVRIEARDASRIASVDVVPPAAAGDALTADEAPPGTWSGRLDTAHLPDGPLTIAIVAADALGNIVEREHTFVVDRTAPALDVEVSATEEGRIAGERASGVIAVQARAMDAAGPITVTVEAVGVPDEALVEVPPAPDRGCAGLEPCAARWVQLDTRQLPDGPTTIRIRAVDALGNASEETLRLGVDNAPPALEVAVVPGAAGAVAGSRIAGTVEVRVRASAPEGAPHVTVGADLPPEVGGVLVGEASTGSADEPETTHWMGQLDTRALTDGPVTLRVSATDAMGSRVDRAIELTVDNTPPGLRLVPPAAIVSEVNGRWYTDAEALETAIEAEDASGFELTVELDGQPQPVDGSMTTLTFPTESLYTIDVIAVDALGNRTSTHRRVAVDRTPPTLEHKPTTLADERLLAPDRRLEGVPRVTLSTEREVRISKWQNHWGPGDDNPAVVEWHVLDVPSGGAETHAHRLTFVWATGPGDLGSTPVQTVLGAEARRFELTADTLGIDPLRAPPAPDTPVRIQVEVRDLAGNRARAALDLRLDVIPPPLEVTVVEGDPGNRTRVSEASLGDGTFWDLFEGSGSEGIEIARVRVHNPHDIPVGVDLEHGPSMVLDLAVGVGVVGRTVAEMEREQVDHERRRPEFEQEVDRFDVVIYNIALEPCSLPRLERITPYVPYQEPNVEPVLGELTYAFYDCLELTEVASGTWTVASPVRVDADGGPLDDGDFVVAPDEAVTMKVVADPLPPPAPVFDLVRTVDAELLSLSFTYTEPIENHVVYADIPNAEVDYRLCSRCFEGEDDCFPACQPAGQWIGRRVRGITDARIGSEGEAPWVVRAVSADGSLRGAATRLPAWERRLRNESLPIAWR